MVTADPATGERRPDPALRMLTRAWALAHATGRREDEAVLTDVLAERARELALARGYEIGRNRKREIDKVQDMDRARTPGPDRALSASDPGRAARQRAAEEEAERIFNVARARAEDRLLGIEHPETEDPLSAKAVELRAYMWRLREALQNPTPELDREVDRLLGRTREAPTEGKRQGYTKTGDRGGIDW
jgi:hypothetical protein